MYGLEKFEYYLLGRHALIETDHSSLEQIFKKNITETPTRLQRLLLTCLKYDITVQYKKGIDIPAADAFSRVCTNKTVHNLHTVDFITNISAYFSLFTYFFAL